MNLLWCSLEELLLRRLTCVTFQSDDTNSEKKKDDYTSDAQYSVPEFRFPNFLDYIVPYFEEFTAADTNA